MTTFSKKNVLTFDPAPEVEGVCKDRICACMMLCASFPLIIPTLSPPSVRAHELTLVGYFKFPKFMKDIKHIRRDFH